VRVNAVLEEANSEIDDPTGMDWLDRKAGESVSRDTWRQPDRKGVHLKSWIKDQWFTNTT
jgi:hypothetical protein